LLLQVVMFPELARVDGDGVLSLVVEKRDPIVFLV
jgi:hypothetical protein